MKIFGNIICIGFTGLMVLAMFSVLINSEDLESDQRGKVCICSVITEECEQPELYDEPKREIRSRILKVEYEVNNPTNTTVYFHNSQFDYYYVIDEEEYTGETLYKRNSKIIDKYDNVYVLPGGEKGKYIEYVAIEPEATKMYVVNYISDEESEEFAIDL